LATSSRAIKDIFNIRKRKNKDEKKEKRTG
jgi:hypothetical protein